MEWFKECQAVISGEGVSSPLSPRRLRAKYTLRTNLRFMLRGFRPCRGQICASANLQSERAGLYLSMPSKRRAHGWHCCLRLHFVVDMQHRLWDFTERSPFAAVRKRQTWNTRIWASVRNQPSYNCCSQKVMAADYLQKEGRKYL